MQSTSYFFPNNRHRMKNHFRQNPLFSIQRKEIKDKLILYQEHNKTFSPTEIGSLFGKTKRTHSQFDINSKEKKPVKT